MKHSLRFELANVKTKKNDKILPKKSREKNTSWPSHVPTYNLTSPEKLCYTSSLFYPHSDITDIMCHVLSYITPIFIFFSFSFSMKNISNYEDKNNHSDVA